MEAKSHELREKQTFRLAVDPADLHSPAAQAALDRAAAILRAGGTVALPTETVYGLGANALDPAAVARIFAAKERPSWDPLIVHIADESMLEGLVQPPSENAAKLMAAFWPGPLTLLLPKTAAVPDSVTAGRPLVAVRMPAHPVARELIRRAGVPVAAPSANRFGYTSPTTAAHVLADLDGRIDAVIDSGASAHGLESTVVDPDAGERGTGQLDSEQLAAGGLGKHPVTIYRPGAISLEAIQAVIGPATVYRPPASDASLAAGHTARQALSGQESLPAPGVGLRHYAPFARVVLIEGAETELLWLMEEELARIAGGAQGEKLGLMLPEGLPLNRPAGLARGLGWNGESQPRQSPAIAPLPRVEIYPWGTWTDLEELASRLFAGLRWLDDHGCTVIVCPLPAEQGIGLAIRDRLIKAAKP